MAKSIKAVGYELDSKPEVSVLFSVEGLGVAAYLTIEQAESLRKDLKQAIKDAQA